MLKLKPQETRTYEPLRVVAIKVKFSLLSLSRGGKMHSPTNDADAHVDVTDNKL